MANNDTRIQRGQHLSPKTEFKPGQHWRPAKPWWQRDWLFREYIERQRSASDIAAAGNCTASNILYWLKRHRIPTRPMDVVRKIKHWGAVGESNPMFGKRGILNPAWKGGLTPARQRVYAKAEWKKLVRDVHRRDKTCRLCNSNQNLHVHHIDPFSHAPLLVLDIGNVILLCQECHHKITRKEARWKKRLFNLLTKERR